MKRGLTWLIAGPLMLAACEAAHELSYLLVDPDAAERHRVLEQSGHSYFAQSPLLIGVGLGLLVTGFLCRAVAVLRGKPDWKAPARVFALLPALAFVLQEAAERLVHTGSFSFSGVLTPTLPVGLLLQVPFGLLAYLLARAVAHAAERVALALGFRQPAPRSRLPLPVAAALAAEPPLIRLLAFGRGERAPPFAWV
jgi:hypothetical protein